MALGRIMKRNKEVNKVVLLPLDQIIRNPYQPRKFFDSDAIQELCESISVNGLLQPITVRELADGEEYELIAGERRMMAFQGLGRTHIPAIIEKYTDKQSAVLALVENLQRKDLHFFEEAQGIQRLMQELGQTQQQISEQLGMAQSTIANKLRLLRFPAKIQEEILRAGLTERHARALLKIQGEEQQYAVLAIIIAKGFNVEQTERYIEEVLQKAKPQKKSRIFVVKDIRIFVNSINKAVSLMNQAGIPTETVKQETDGFLEFVIRVPKTAAYKEGKHVV